MKNRVDNFVIVKTNVYTGNCDSFLIGLLFGWDDDRHGGSFGKSIHIPHPFTKKHKYYATHPDSEGGEYGFPYVTMFDENENNLSVYVNEITEEYLQFLKANYVGKTFNPGEYNGEDVTILGFAKMVRTTVVTETVVDI